MSVILLDRVTMFAQGGGLSVSKPETAYHQIGHSPTSLGGSVPYKRRTNTLRNSSSSSMASANGTT
jgi:hypothetical protein